MTTPLPRPADIDIAGWADVHIKALAYAIDARLGGAVKTATVSDYPITTEANGEFTVWFAGLGTPIGALVLPSGVWYLQSPITTYPPVPPASIGNVVRTAPTWVGLCLFAPGGAVRCRAYQPPSNLGDKNGYPQQVSTQPANAGQSMKVVGLAWAPV